MFNRPYDVDHRGLPIKNEKYFTYNRKFNEFHKWLCSLSDKERDEFLKTKRFYTHTGQQVKFVRSLVERLPNSAYLIVFLHYVTPQKQVKIIDVNFGLFDVINENTFIARKPIVLVSKESEKELTLDYAGAKSYKDFGLTDEEYKAGIDYDI